MSLLFKREFFDAIRSGAKTTTVRYWRPSHAGRFQVGQLLRPPFLDGRLRVEAVEPIRLTDLTDGDASADGFADLDVMLARLRELYPELLSPAPPPGRRLFRIRFTYRR